MTITNIKNLPKGRYVTECLYSDSHAWKVIKKTKRTMTVAAVEVERDPEWKPEIHAGGFAGHCSNQHQQTWLFSRVNRDLTTTIRLNKKGQWVHKGTRFIRGVAKEFYDYNF